MARNSFAVLALCLLFWPAASSAGESRPAIIVTPGSARTYRAAIQHFPDTNGRTDTFYESLAEALEFSNVFKRVDPVAFLGPVNTQNFDSGRPIVCSDWTQIGADALVQGEMRNSGTEFQVEFAVWDTARCTRLLRRRYRQSITADAALIAKRIGDDVVGAYIGIPGVASTEIAFISNRTGSPEVHVMDANGDSARRATANRSINNFPDWSPDGSSIIYTSYRSENRPRLFLSSRGKSRPGRLLGSIKSATSEYRGVFDPVGKNLAVVLSDGSPSEIYTVRADGRGLRRITHNKSIDISPSWSPDGKRIAFVSDRTGAPQIYLMDADGRNVRRLTYLGGYNSSPAWSPDGKWIAYETRVGGQFDIWLIDPEGQVNVPLITHPRTDEGPSWAPNSRKLAFSSSRRGREDLYVIDVSGDNIRRITQGAGDNTSPSWGPHPR